MIMMLIMKMFREMMCISTKYHLQVVSLDDIDNLYQKIAKVNNNIVTMLLIKLVMINQ